MHDLQAKAFMPTDPQEQALEDAVRASHEALIAKGRELGRILHSTLDPLRQVRNDPAGGVLSGVATGVILDAVRSMFDRSGRRDSAGPMGTASSLIGSLLPSLGTILLPLLKNRSDR